MNIRNALAVRGIAALSACLGICVCQGRTLYVVPPGTPGVAPALPHDSWESAATNLAILGNVAGRGTMGDGDVFLISNGIYTVGAQINPLCAGAMIQGITGDPADVVITPASSYRGRLFWLDGGGWGSRTTWEGLTFSNAFVSAGSYGSAMQNYGATNVTLRQCVFTDNVASNCAGSALVSTGDDLRISDCAFKNNKSGFYYNCSAAAVSCAQVIMSNCTFSGNIAGGPHGGGLYIKSSTATSIIDRCVFSGNTVSGKSYGGAGRNLAPLLMTHCTFESNTNYTGAGGGWHIVNPQTMLADCRFSDNWASFGGGLAFGTIGAVVSNCLFVGNAANAGGGASFYYGQNNLLVDCVFSNNVANAGGGIDTYPGSGEARNCLIVSNQANYGGGVRISSVLGTSHTNRIGSCTISGNAAANTGGGIMLQKNYIGAFEVFNTVIYSNTASTAATHDLQNDGAPVPPPYFHCCTPVALAVGNNIADAPRFADAAARDYRLAPGSPCINSGTNLTWMSGAADLDGRPRIRYGTVDIGCYEQIHRGTAIYVR